MFCPDTEWTQKNPDAVDVDPGLLSDALAYAETRDLGVSFDLTGMMPDGSRHPFDRPLGPVKPRGLTNGVVLRGGYLIGEFGDPNRVDLTFSATKSYISALAGIALGRGLFASLDEPVGKTVKDGGFEGHNEAITWRQLLQQTSEWEGELFGIPDWIDRGRQVSGAAAAAESRVGGSAALADGRRTLGLPGSFWEYNDVRVNRTALALLQLFRRPLPGVLADTLMGPVGCTDTWSWHGYATSGVEIDGNTIESVSGGAHWGGGLWINSYDHARFGHLFLNKGAWNGVTLLDPEWIRWSCEPCELNPAYGLFWWLNHNGGISRVAGPQAFAARGAGGNVVFVDPDREVVIVLRWCADPRDVIDRILGAVA